MNGLMNVKYPVNNDRLNVNRYSFSGKDRKGRRMRAIAFASALADLLNSHMERREPK